MQIVFYGTGSCTPLPFDSSRSFRSYTGWYTEIGKSSLLFDSGAGVLHKMLLDGKDIIKNPTHLCITHFHPDHCSDIVPLMQGRGVYSKNFGSINKLQLAGPNGLKTFMDQVFLGVEKWNREVPYTELAELIEKQEGVVFEDKQMKVTCAPISHYDSVCYRLETEGKIIVYSGDMEYDERISEFGKGADVAILECSYPDRESLKAKHLCPEDIGKLGKLGEFKKIILTHLYPACYGREEEITRTIQNIHNVEVIIAQDMMKVEV